MDEFGNEFKTVPYLAVHQLSIDEIQYEAIIRNIPYDTFNTEGLCQILHSHQINEMSKRKPAPRDVQYNRDKKNKE